MAEEKKPYYRELQPSMLRRIQGWNYKGRGIYMITMVTKNRRRLFGEVSIDSIPTSPHGVLCSRIIARDSVRFTPTQIGTMVGEEVAQISLHYHQIRIIGKQIMPDHVHLLLFVQQQIPVPLGSIIRGYKSHTTKSYLLAQQCASTEHGQHTVDTLWEDGFNDRILLHAGQLDGMVRYIKDNPWRLAMKRANPDLFRMHQQVLVAGYTCTTLGNQFLLDYPVKKALHCSRDLTQLDIDQYKEQCMNEAQSGTIFVSPAVSNGEKQTCRALREAGYPLIILLENGFPAADSPNYKYYKPKGIYFEACAAGRLLLIEPSETLYDKPQIESSVYAKTGVIPHDTPRYHCIALNAMAEQICEGIEETIMK